MHFNFFNSAASFLLPIISIHAALRDFLYRFPLIILICAIGPLLLLSLAPLRKKLLPDVNISNKKLIGTICFSIALFSTFIEVNNSKAVDLKFENLNRFLTFFEESRYAIYKNTNELNYIKNLGKRLAKPKRAEHVDDQRFNVSFNGSLVSTKEISFSEEELQKICDISFGLKTYLLIDNFKKTQYVPTTNIPSIHQISTLINQCGNSILFLWYKEAISYITESLDKTLPITERTKSEINFYNHVSKLNQEKLSQTIELAGKILSESLSSSLATGSQIEGRFFNYPTWDNSYNDCIKIISQNLGFSDLDGAHKTEKNNFKVFYPEHLLFPTFLIDEKSNFIFELNMATEDHRTFCIIEYQPRINFKRLEIAL